MGEEVIFVRRASGLVRELGWLDVAIWALATPAASGMVYYSVKILGYEGVYGGSTVLAFLIAGIMFLPLTIAFILLAASFPRSSSLYVFTSRTLHPVLGYLPFWYFIVGGGAAMASGLLLFKSVAVAAGGLSAAGSIAKDEPLMNLAEFLIKPENALVLVVVLTLIIWVINFTGMRVLKWVMRTLTTIPLVVTVATLGGLALVGIGGGLERWDAMYGVGSAQKIVEAALEAKHGVDVALQPVDLLPGTYEMLLWTVWAWTGLEVVTFVGSEVKDPSKSYLKGCALGFLVVMVIYLANAALLPFAFSYDFLAAYSYLQMNYPEVLGKLMAGMPTPEPSVPFMASVAFGSFAVAMVLTVAYFLWFVNTVIAIWVAGVRGFFSLSFDRMLPERLADVSPKYAAPTWSNHLTAVICILGAVFTFYEYVGVEAAASVIAFMDFSCLFFVWPVGLALMIAPYWRPELFKAMVFPSRILCTVAGALMFAIGWFFAIITSYTEPLIVSVNVVVGLVGLLAFIIMAEKNRVKGIEVEKIYTQIPPT